ncbi:MAG: transporter substrate-binding domain-containing protein [Coriobacteriales bacterium]|nr:transporter substrate-binding domain-containing protein [Coriobacteriales bacterium]
MKRRVVAVLSLLVCLLVSGALIGCSDLPSLEQAQRQTQMFPTVSEKATITEGVLTIGVNTENPPYAWRTSSAVTPVEGVDIDVALALAENMGLTAHFVNIGTNVNAAANGACDIVMGVQGSVLTDGRELVIGSYSDSAPAIFGAEQPEVVTVTELAISDVGVQDNSVSARALQTIAPTCLLTPYATLNDAFAALAAGDVDYVACDSFMGGYLATAYPTITMVGALSLPETRGIAVATSNGELQTAVRSALDTISSNGKLRLIREKWVGDLGVITSSTLVVNQ